MAPPPHITTERLEVLVKLATEKQCYLEWQDSLAPTSTSLSTASTSGLAIQDPDVGHGKRNLAMPMGDLGPGISSLPRPPGDLGSRHECQYLEQGKVQGDVAMISKAANNLVNEAKAAYEDGVWQTDASRHAKHRKVDPSTIEGGTTVLQASPGKATLKMAYFFSGVKRKASIAEQLKTTCAKQGLGLVIFEIDVLVGGDEHDLLNKEFRRLGWPESKTANSTSLSSHPLAAAGAGQTGRTTMVRSHVGTGPSHGASRPRKLTNNEGQTRGTSSSTSPSQRSGGLSWREQRGLWYGQSLNIRKTWVGWTKENQPASGNSRR